MKCYKMLKVDYDLPYSLFKRIGAFYGPKTYSKHVYVSPETLIKVEAAIKATAATKYANAEARKLFIEQLMINNGPLICMGLPTGYLLVNTSAISNEILNEEMVSELARNSGRDTPVTILRSPRRQS